MWKPQFLRKLTESVYLDEYDEIYDNPQEDKYDSINNQQDGLSNEVPMGHNISLKDTDAETESTSDTLSEKSEKVEELQVDVYQTTDDIVVRAMVAGAKPHNIDISLTRDMITITGSKEETKEVTEDDYFYRELSWGSFTRTIMLPAEVEVDEADAQEKHGVLTIRLPKINKERQAKIKVKSH